ncbi:MAG TPA: hypothetical protein VF274_12250 [Alphaproteobacteria bacterium]
MAMMPVMGCRAVRAAGADVVVVMMWVGRSRRFFVVIGPDFWHLALSWSARCCA